MLKICFAVACLVCSLNLYAQYVPHDGDLDSTFGIDGAMIIPTRDYTPGFLVLPNDELITIQEREDGQSAGVNFSQGMIRLTKNGRTDSSFGTNGFKDLNIQSSNNLFSTIFNYSSEKIFLQGYVQGSNSGVSLLCRYLPDGSPDLTFNGTGIDTCFTGVPTILEGAPGVVQADGKYIALSEDRDISSNYKILIARYNNDGSIDKSFCECGTGTVVIEDSTVSGYPFSSSIALQPDGKILVAGYNENTNILFFLFRYNNNGTLDTTFGNKGNAGLGQPFIISSLHALPSGEIIAAGAGTDTNSFLLERFESNGTPDKNFAVNGSAYIHYFDSSDYNTPQNYAVSMAVQADHKIIIAGNGNALTPNGTYLPTIMRFNENGNIDSTFGVNGIVFPVSMCPSTSSYCDDEITTIGLQSNGDIITMQHLSDSQNVFKRYMAHATDTTVTSIAPVISVYPNPSSGNYTVSATNLNSVAVMTVYDVVGRKLFTVQHDFSVSATTQVDITHLPTGIYFLKVMPLRGETKVVKLLKE